MKHGDECASALAIEWCRRMQFWFDMWCSGAAGGDYSYTELDILSYEESARFLYLLQRLPSGAFAQRAAQVRDVIPRVSPL